MRPVMWLGIASGVMVAFGLVTALATFGTPMFRAPMSALPWIPYRAAVVSGLSGILLAFIWLGLLILGRRGKKEDES